MEMLYQLSYNGIVGGVGFEPTKAEPTDLQSVPFDRSGIHPFFECTNLCQSREQDLNPRPAVYKTAALPLSYPGIDVKLFMTYSYLIVNLVNSVLKTFQFLIIGIDQPQVIEAL